MIALLVPFAVGAFAWLAGYLAGVRNGVAWSVDRMWERSGSQIAADLDGEG